MRKFLSVVILALSFQWTGLSQVKSWTCVSMDASRTGVQAAGADNVSEAMGIISGNKYTAPNARVFRKGKGSTYEVASLMIGCQDVMKPVKESIGYSENGMRRGSPESPLSNWFVDRLMAACDEIIGKHADLGVVNFGGIREDMPKGEILLDDLMSMFPFKNSLCYVALEGKDVIAMLEKMAAGRFQVLGGVRCVAENGKLVEATIGGKPIDPKKIYGVATISFLLNGGDNLFVAKNAKDLVITEDMVIDVMLPYVKKLTAEGKTLDYECDGRVVIKGDRRPKR